MDKALPATPVNLKMRTDLAAALCKRVESWHVTQAVAAARLGVSQPRLNDLLRGRIEKFSLDALTNLAPGAGLNVELRAEPLITAAPRLGTPALTVNEAGEHSSSENRGKSRG